MGCDIHLYVERQDQNGRWWKCQDGFKSDYYDESSDYFKQERFKDGDQPYSGRNYDVFAYLADVRNGYGFAGCDTGDAIIPMAQPRGLPKDVSLMIQEQSDSWDCDGHSHSYFTLGELKQAYKDAENQIKVHRGWVGVDNYKEFKEKGKPTSYSGGVSGGRVEHITNEQMDLLLSGEFATENGKSYYTQVEWKETLKENIGYFFEHIIPQMEKWGYDDNEDDKIRIVFWFDN